MRVEIPQSEGGFPSPFDCFVGYLGPGAESSLQDAKASEISSLVRGAQSLVGWLVPGGVNGATGGGGGGKNWDMKELVRLSSEVAGT